MIWSTLPPFNFVVYATFNGVSLFMMRSRAQVVYVASLWKWIVTELVGADEHEIPVRRLVCDLGN